MKCFTRHLCFFALLYLTACHSYSDTDAPARNTDLFKDTSADTVLFKPSADSSFLTLNADTALKRSTVVAVASISDIDSTVHGTTAPFYLLTAQVDTIVKGTLRKQSLQYFIMMRRPPSGMIGHRWWCYWVPASAQSLPAKSGIRWQWLKQAPFIPYSATQVLPKDTVSAIRGIYRRLHHHRRRRVR